jgi:hypothetical protein
MHPDYLTYLKDLPFTSCLNRDIRALCTASRSTISSKTTKRSQQKIHTTTKVPSQNFFFLKKKKSLITSCKELHKNIHNFGQILRCILAE